MNYNLPPQPNSPHPEALASQLFDKLLLRPKTSNKNIIIALPAIPGSEEFKAFKKAFDILLKSPVANHLKKFIKLESTVKDEIGISPIANVPLKYANSKSIKHLISHLNAGHDVITIRSQAESESLKNALDVLARKYPPQSPISLALPRAADLPVPLAPVPLAQQANRTKAPAAPANNPAQPKVAPVAPTMPARPQALGATNLPAGPPFIESQRPNKPLQNTPQDPAKETQLTHPNAISPINQTTLQSVRRVLGSEYLCGKSSHWDKTPEIERYFTVYNKGDEAFEVHAAKITTCSENVDTYVAMLKTFKQQYPNLEPTITVYDNSKQAKQLWEQACDKMHISKANIVSTPAPEAQPPSPPSPRP